MFSTLFKTLVFSEKETNIYTTLLKLGTANASRISRNTDLNRTTVYDVIESLMRKGLVSKYKKGGATFFNAFEPRHLLTYLDREHAQQAKTLERQKAKVQELLPELVSLQDIAVSRPRVRFFEGEKGMREAYEDTLGAKDMIFAYANVATMHEALPYFFPEYYQRRAKSKIFIRVIVPRNKLSMERARHNQEEMRETKFLPAAEMTFSPEVNIYNNKMLVVSWEEKMVVIIESRELADLQKLVFNLLWSFLPKHISK